MSRLIHTCLGLGCAMLSLLVNAESKVGSFSSVVTIQGPVNQTATGNGVNQDLNIGSAQKSQTNTFSSVVTTGSITQTGNNGAQQSINVGGMNNSKADKFDARVSTGNIEQVGNRGEKQELDIGSVTNSTVSGTATTRVSTGAIKQTGDGEIVLGAVKNSNVQQFRSNLSVQGKLEGNNIRMGSIVGQERYDNQGHYGDQKAAESIDSVGSGNPSKLVMPRLGGVQSVDTGSINLLTGTGSLAPMPQRIGFDSINATSPNVGLVIGPYIPPYQSLSSNDACPSALWNIYKNSDFSEYNGKTHMFHCGYDTFVGKYRASDGLYPECVYDEKLALVTKYHEHAKCMGSADEYRNEVVSKFDYLYLHKWVPHTFFDSGGIADLDNILLFTPYAIDGFLESLSADRGSINSLLISFDNQKTNVEDWTSDEVKVAKQLLLSGVKFSAIKPIVTFYRNIGSGRSFLQAYNTTKLAMSSAVTRSAIVKLAAKDIMFQFTLGGYALDQTSVNAGRIKFESPDGAPWYVDIGYDFADTLNAWVGVSTAHSE